MKAYLDLLDLVRRDGEYRSERTKTGATSLFAAPDFRHDLSEGFPLLTTKRVHLKSIIVELIWFLTGGTNVKFLQENGVTIWDEWADQDGNLGPTYGKQWRDFGGGAGDTQDGNGVDQIAQLVDGLKRDPYGRRHIVSAWNPVDVPDMKLPPCHYCFQCYVRREGFLDLKMSKRSTDIFLGLPFNIATYALLIHVLASVTGLKPGRLIVTFGDLHLYRNHYEQAQLQLIRNPLPLPSLSLQRKLENPWDLKLEDVILTDYVSHPAIAAPVAV
jgi:thymidylate synthase